jgi:hypothetical protein
MAQALQRLGETEEFRVQLAEWAHEIVRELARCGWDSGFAIAFAGDGFIGWATKGELNVRRSGETTLRAMHEVFKGCAELEQLRPIERPNAVQLRLA